MFDAMTATADAAAADDDDAVTSFSRQRNLPQSR